MKIFLSKKSADIAYNFIKERLFLDKTKMLYDHVVVGKEQSFPTIKEIESSYPNPCGYSTGMEDGIISGATMIDALLIKYQKEKKEEVKVFVKKILSGMLDCAFSAKEEGFLPRALSVEDAKSHYEDSSRDQYTMFAFAMHRYINSQICTEEEREKIATAIINIAKRLYKNVTKENDYDMLTESGRKSLVTKMWGNLDNHEYLRLPMIYLLAYEVSKDEFWLKEYESLRDIAYEKSLPMIDYWALYALQQMQVSVLLCYEIDPSKEWKQRYLSLMNVLLTHAEKMADDILKKIRTYKNYNQKQVSFRELVLTKQERFISLGYKDALYPNRTDIKEYFALQDGAQLSIITGLVPKTKISRKTLKLFKFAHSKIDYSLHESNLPIYFFDGYYRIINSQKT